jgi:hypothetical protein
MISNVTQEKEGKTKSELVRDLLETLSGQGVSSQDIIGYIKVKEGKVEKLPVSIFCLGLSPLQAVVKFLFENKAYSFSEIARLLNRDQRTIWNTYHSTKKEKPELLNPDKTNYYVNISVFRDRSLSFLENLCMFLKTNYPLNYHKIAALLGKDDRTVWTVCKRAERKNANKTK